MSGDLAALAGEVSPYVTAAVGAYGAAVLTRAQQDAADATVGWGRRILQRIFGVDPAEDEVPPAVAELAEDPDDADLQAALRVRIRRMLAADPRLAADVAEMVEAARAQVTASGQTQINAVAHDHARQAVQGQGVQYNTFGPSS
ncbi:hypothetical protein [Streptosporangium carneum]|uniref:Uncharacterized protein n=1 Tax=Streptosporangium carneum TaxID=47481 RepID=A0A9W6I912_9ACTN|nr:hypothetical protein [Streptosporangium carneum]GLK14326.1 hypothetical protein GCM10017600_77380 [Streptosporangium carneum]